MTMSSWNDLVDLPWLQDCLFDFFDVVDTCHVASTSVAGMGVRLDSGELRCTHLRLAPSRKCLAHAFSHISLKMLESFTFSDGDGSIDGLGIDIDTGIQVALALGQMTSLKKLELYFANLPDREKSTLDRNASMWRIIARFLRQAHNLRSLIVNVDCEYLGDLFREIQVDALVWQQIWLPALSKLSLEVLEIDFLDLGHAHFPNCIASSNKLRVLGLECSQGSPESLAALLTSVSRNCGVLEELKFDIADIEWPHWPVLMNGLLNLPHLRKLSLRGLQIFERVVRLHASEALACPLPEWVQEVNLEETGGLDDIESCTILANILSPAAQLRSICLMGSRHMSGDGLKAILAALKPMSLRILNLNGCDLGPSSVAPLASFLENHGHMQTLFLNGNELGPGISTLLETLDTVSSLRTVVFDDTVKANIEARKRLEAMRSQVTVKFAKGRWGNCVSWRYSGADVEDEDCAEDGTEDEEGWS